MKVPPKRKGNRALPRHARPDTRGLNESPSEKEGKSFGANNVPNSRLCLNESPSEKEGKLVCLLVFNALIAPQ